MENLKLYNNDELSRIIENNENMYDMFIGSVRANDWENVLTMINEKYIYTKEQLKELKRTFIFCKDFV